MTLSSLHLRLSLSRLLAWLTLSLCCVCMARAQPFSVSGFRALPNDISAFVHPVRDNNANACALIKVQASSDFAFSTPLGIVRRVDKVGEIWLYVPQGTRLLTIKHPRWGVLRDYRLPSALESRLAYELTLRLPPSPVVLRHDTVVRTQVLRDTIVTVAARPRIPLSLMTLATVGAYAHGPSWGLMAVVGKRNGAFLHVAGDLRGKVDERGVCSDDGQADGWTVTPYYSGRIEYRHYLITGGAAHRLSRWLYLYEGLGFGRRYAYWQLAPSEGGGYLRCRDRSAKGIAAETGLVVTVGRCCFSASASTVKGKYWQAQIGVGIKIK